MIKKIFDHRITKNVKALIGLQLVNYISPLLVLVFLTNKLGIETYGIIAFSFAIIQFSWVLMDLGFSLSATRIISAKRNNKNYVNRYIGAIFIVKMIIFTTLSLIVFIFALSTDKYADHYLLFILGLLPILGQAFQPIWFFSGIEVMKLSAFFMVLAKLLFLIIIYINISDESDYLWVPIANGISQIIAAAVGIFFIYKLGYKISMPRKKDIIYAYKSTSSFFVSRVSYVSYLQGGTIFLGLIATSTEVAIYSLAIQLYTVMKSIFMPINQAVFPYMTKEKNLSLYLKISIGVFMLVVFCSIIAYFLAPLLIPIVFGDKWGETIQLFNIFLIALVFNVLAVMSGYPLATALNRIEVANQSVNFTVIIFFCILVFLYFYNLIVPLYVGFALLVAEIYLFAHRAITLWPLFSQQLKQKKDADNL